MDTRRVVSPSRGSPPKAHKFYTVERANRALPLVRRIAADVVANYRRLQRWERRDREWAARGDVTEEQMQESFDYADRLIGRLFELQEELENLGLELKDSAKGLVDFPAEHQGRRVYLCWKLGEEKVAHWHELKAGYAGRRPLDREFGPGS